MYPNFVTAADEADAVNHLQDVPTGAYVTWSPSMGDLRLTYKSNSSSGFGTVQIEWHSVGSQDGEAEGVLPVACWLRMNPKPYPSLPALLAARKYLRPEVQVPGAAQELPPSFAPLMSGASGAGTSAGVLHAQNLQQQVNSQADMAQLLHLRIPVSASSLRMGVHAAVLVLAVLCSVAALLALQVDYSQAPTMKHWLALNERSAELHSESLRDAIRVGVQRETVGERGACAEELSTWSAATAATLQSTQAGLDSFLDMRTPVQNVLVAVAGCGLALLVLAMIGSGQPETEEAYNGEYNLPQPAILRFKLPKHAQLLWRAAFAAVLFAWVFTFASAWHVLSDAGAAVDAWHTRFRLLHSTHSDFVSSGTPRHGGASYALTRSMAWSYDKPVPAACVAAVDHAVLPMAVPNPQLLAVKLSAWVHPALSAGSTVLGGLGDKWLKTQSYSIEHVPLVEAAHAQDSTLTMKHRDPIQRPFWLAQRIVVHRLLLGWLAVQLVSMGLIWVFGEAVAGLLCCTRGSRRHKGKASQAKAKKD